MVGGMTISPSLSCACSNWNFLTRAFTLGGVSGGAFLDTLGVVGASGKKTSCSMSANPLLLWFRWNWWWLCGFFSETTFSVVPGDEVGEREDVDVEMLSRDCNSNSFTSVVACVRSTVTSSSVWSSTGTVSKGNGRATESSRSHLCSKHSSTDILSLERETISYISKLVTNSINTSSTTHFGLILRALLIKSMATGETFSKSSSGKVREHLEMLRKVSCLLSPPNGEHPVRSTYESTPMDQMSVFRDSGSYWSTSGAT